MVVETTPELVRLPCTRDELAKMDRFMGAEFVEIDSLYPEELGEDYLMWP
jgi:hypothetical protein